MSHSPMRSDVAPPRFDIEAPRLAHIAGTTPLTAGDRTAWNRFAMPTALYRAGYELS